MPVPPHAPRHPVGPDGAACFGAFEGACESTSLGGAAERLRLTRALRLVREKRWVWFGVADARLSLGGAIVDLGYVGSIFLWVVDREAKRLVVDGSATVLPFLVEVGDRPGEGLIARARTHRGHLVIAWRHGTVEVRGAAMGAELSVALATTPRALTAVCPVPGLGEGGVNVTQKATCLPASGTVRWGGKLRTLDHALGSLDYTHGLLARDTSWRWAACWGRGPGGRPVAANLVSGFNDGLENAIWIDGRPRAVGLATFVHDPAHPTAPWRVTTADGQVDLSLRVEAIREEDVDLGVAASRFVQPIGAFSGRIGEFEVRNLAGVAEDHVARW
jgi:hypothetical protein